MVKISVVINTLNEEKNIQRAIGSVGWADEIVVCDMDSEDQTREIAEKSGAKVFLCKRQGFVEPARNFAISKATGNWILILDADEEIPESLAKRLKELVSKQITSDYIEIPRKNIIFSRWMSASGWWPDYQIRFFKKGAVVWNSKIHSKPKFKGMGLKLPAEEKLAIVHHNYQTIWQFIERMNRYTTIEAEQLLKDGYQFKWTDLFQKPLDEFLSRFFANKGYQDSLHGFALSLLQAFAFFTTYLKVWQFQGFQENKITLSEVEQEKKKGGYAIDYWMKQVKKSTNPFKGFFKNLIH
ncbi:glycosyltransferase family 2 protein [Candidatus Daviesbacteria bacterium]|nr:glycosyltransferase family 2 protein [Candidatus Daviesbacteria bacterium]